MLWHCYEWQIFGKWLINKYVYKLYKIISARNNFFDYTIKSSGNYLDFITNNYGGSLVPDEFIFYLNCQTTKQNSEFATQNSEFGNLTVSYPCPWYVASCVYPNKVHILQNCKLQFIWLYNSVFSFIQNSCKKNNEVSRRVTGILFQLSGLKIYLSGYQIIGIAQQVFWLMHLSQKDPEIHYKVVKKRKAYNLSMSCLGEFHVSGVQPYVSNFHVSPSFQKNHNYNSNLLMAIFMWEGY